MTSDKEVKQSDRGFFASAYHTLVVENNVEELWKAWLTLTIIDGLIGVFLNRGLEIYGPLDIDLSIYMVFTIVLLAIIIIPTRVGVVKRNGNWVLLPLILITILFVWQQTQEDTKQGYQLALNIFSGTGYIKSKIYLGLLIFWDQLFGSLFEIFLLFRIYSILNTAKS